MIFIAEKTKDVGVIKHMLLFLIKHFLFSSACLHWSGQGCLYSILCWGLLKLLQVTWVAALVLIWRSPWAPHVGPVVSLPSAERSKRFWKCYPKVAAKTGQMNLIPNAWFPLPTTEGVWGDWWAKMEIFILYLQEFGQINSAAMWNSFLWFLGILG